MRWSRGHSALIRLTIVIALAAGCQAQTLAQLQAAYVAQGCGAFFHYNMTTYDVTASAGWASPNLSPSTFAPTVNVATLTANMNAWAAGVAAAGCKYAAFTVKHVDGFSLWPTARAVSGFSPYSIAQTSWYSSNGNPDLVSIFVTACRNNGLNPVLYFSIWDTTMEARDTNCSTLSAACYTDYLAMIEAELTELLTNYGSITALWTDAWGWKYGYVNIPYATIYNFIKGLQPNCLLVENNHEGTVTHTDIVTFEVPAGYAFPSVNTLPAEGDNTIHWNDAWWFWNPNYSYAPSMLRSPRAIYEDMAYYNARNGTFLLDFTPDKAGLVPAAEFTAYAGWRAERNYLTKGGASATCSSTYAGTASPSALIDNVFWATGISGLVSTAATDTSPYCEIDMVTAKVLERVEVFGRSDISTPGSGGRLRDLTLTLYDATHVQVRQIAGINAGNTGYGNYVGDGTYTNGPGQLSIQIAPTVSARYVRIARTPDAGAGNNDDKNDLVLMEIIPYVYTGMFPLPGAVGR